MVFIIMLAFLVGFSAIYIVYRIHYMEATRTTLLAHVEDTKKEFEHHQHEVFDSLMVALDILEHDKRTIELFKARDRAGLHAYLNSGFTDIKGRYGISLFYFIEPDGRVFLRVHNKELHGDKAHGAFFDEVMRTGKAAAGFSLGRSGYAYRVAKPLKAGDKVIGYIELGHDIVRLVKHLNIPEYSAVGVTVSKEMINKDYWATGYKPNLGGYEWSTLDHYAVVSTQLRSEGSVEEDSVLKECFKETNIDVFSKKPAFEYLKDGDEGQKYYCYGFPIVNVATGANEGTFVGVSDMKKKLALTAGLAKTLLYAMLFPVMVSILLVWLLIKVSISTPIERLFSAAKSFAAGDFSTRIPVKGNDEMAELAVEMNDMASQIAIYKTNMELLVDMRTEELRTANQETLEASAMLKEAYDKLEKHQGELEEAFRELEKVNAELKGLERLKSDFLQTISHELRSPLTPILGYLEIMRDGDVGEFSEVQKDVINEMFMCGRNLQLVLDELLEAASIQAGRIFLNVQHVDMKNVLGDVISDIMKYANENQIVVEKDLGAAPLYVDGDPKRLYEIVTHLLRNAVKFSRKGGKVTVKASAGATGIEMMIKDEGIGISPERLTKIFDAFYQIDSSSARFYEGVGLGLFLVRKLLDLHNGRIRVESVETKGTTFYVFIPYKISN